MREIAEQDTGPMASAVTPTNTEAGAGRAENTAIVLLGATRRTVALSGRAARRAQSNTITFTTRPQLQQLIRPEQTRLKRTHDGPHAVVNQRFVGRGWIADCMTQAGVIPVECPENPVGAQARVVIEGALWAIPG